MNSTKYFFLQSPYRLALVGQLLGLAGIWYFWLRTDQIISLALPLYTSGAVIINTLLTLFSYNRHRYITHFIFYVSYGVLIAAIYTLFSLTRGLNI